MARSACFLGTDGGAGHQAGKYRHSVAHRLEDSSVGRAYEPVAYYLVLFAAYDRLPGQEAMALNYTWALAMAFLAVPLLGQRLTRMDIVAGLVAYAGVWVIATRGAILNVSFADPLGRAGTRFDSSLGAVLAA